jgi:hypothetical protein
MRDASEYRATRKARRGKGLAKDLKAERLARGITRRQLDRERGYMTNPEQRRHAELKAAVP